MITQPKILFEDNKIVVAVKPPGMLSQSDFTSRPDILNFIKNHIREKYNKPGEAFIGLVHRLDKEVGGIMVFARNSKSAKYLSEQIKFHNFDKKYIAQFENWNLAECGVLEDYLKKDSKKNISNFTDDKDPEGKKSKLEYKVLENKSGAAKVEIKIITGRSHQIRAQFGLRGQPIIGDVKYGYKKTTDEYGMRLWAYSLSFSHPATKEVVTYKDTPIWY